MGIYDNQDTRYDVIDGDGSRTDKIKFTCPHCRKRTELVNNKDDETLGEGLYCSGCRTRIGTNG